MLKNSVFVEKQQHGVENSVLLKCRKLRREDQETLDWIVSRMSLFYDMSLVSVVIEISFLSNLQVVL